MVRSARPIYKKKEKGVKIEGFRESKGGKNKPPLRPKPKPHAMRPKDSKK